MTPSVPQSANTILASTTAQDALSAWHTFGPSLQQARKAAGLSRSTLAQRVGLDTSYIYRVETGARRPSRDVALALAEALGEQGEARNAWLLAAGYAPMPLLPHVRGAVRTRGRGRTPGLGSTAPSSTWETARWAQWLEAMGLQETTIAHLLQALDTAGPQERQIVTQAVASTLTHLIERLQAPLHTAVIPAAGGQHRLFAPHVMQSLLIRAIQEAVDSGLSHVVLILAPGASDVLSAPLQAALAVAIVPPLTFHTAEQAQPNGLGDALLQAESLVGQAPFAVLLPDDIVRERTGRTVYPRELHRMMAAAQQVPGAHLLAVTPVPRSRMAHGGVVRVARQEAGSTLRPVLELVEKPPPHAPICRSPLALGIVGRYVLQPSIFEALRQCKAQTPSAVHLTDALEQVRRQGQAVYACALAAQRDDLGALFTEAHTRLGAATAAPPRS